MNGHASRATVRRLHLRPLQLVKVAILADSAARRPWADKTPRAMAEIGGRPLIWHMMMHFAQHGLREFVVGLGRGGDQIKRYLVDLCDLSSGNLKLQLADGRVERQDPAHTDWSVNLIDTHKSQLQGLVPSLRRGTFMLSRGDSLDDIDVEALLAFHRGHSHLGTIVAVQPAPRFGKLDLVGDEVVDFAEKPRTGDGWTSAGLFVLEPDVFDYFQPDATEWERQLIERLADAGELMAYKHESFWQSVETLRDRQLLEALWQSDSPPWKNWE